MESSNKQNLTTKSQSQNDSE